MRRAFALFALLAAELAHAGTAGILIPPVEIDLGVGAPVGADVAHLAPSTEILAGIHWASLAWRPTRFDVGVGYVGSFRVVHDDVDRELRMHGGYFSLATRIAGAKHWRTWVAARGELLRASDGMRDFSAIGGSLRVATEIYGSGAGGGNNAAVCGTIAVGIYVEATYRDLPAHLGPFGVTSGLSARLPFVIAGG